MRKGRSEALRKFFSVIGILFLVNLLIGMIRGTFSTNENCKRVVNKYHSVYVKDKLLRDVIKLCSTDGIMLPDNRFNFSYLKNYLREFDCPQSLEYLKVPKPLVALASYPGSGNTWTRELIEAVSGLHTGSVYTDWNFVGSQRCPTHGKVFIIKTHLQSTRTKHPDCVKLGVSNLSYSKVVVILRNPYHSLLAEFSRRHAVKPENDTFFNPGVGIPTRDVFLSKKWTSFVIRESNKWKDMILYWTMESETPAYVLVYERVRENTILEMYKLMEYVNIKVSFNSLYCLSSNKTGNYHRVKPEWMTKEKLYDKTLRNIVNAVIENVSEKVGFKKNITDVLHSYFFPAD